MFETWKTVNGVCAWGVYDLHGVDEEALYR